MIDPKRIVVAMAAPLSPTTEAIAEQKKHAELHPAYEEPGYCEAVVMRENIARAQRWVGWLVKHTDWSIVASWLPYVSHEAGLDEASFRRRGISDGLAVIERCDAIVLVGGRVSEGMLDERDHARLHRRFVINLTHLGAEPPQPNDGEHAKALDVIRKAEAVLAMGEDGGGQ